MKSSRYAHRNYYFVQLYLFIILYYEYLINFLYSIDIVKGSFSVATNPLCNIYVTVKDDDW